MKNILTVLLVVCVAISTKAFDYKSYVVSYLDSVNHTQVGDGVCSSLLYNLFKPITDSMLVDTRKGAWGQPFNGDLQVGDVLTYGNHISIVYSIKGSDVLIADQNNAGRITVLIHKLSKDVYGFKNFQAYHPIMLKDVLYSTKGRDFCLRLFVINTCDTDKVARSSYVPKAGERHYIDLNLEYNEAEYTFATYFNGKVYTKDCECRVNIPNGYIIVEKLDDVYFRPVNVVNY